jgi:hypothetical protein
MKKNITKKIITILKKQYHLPAYLLKLNKTIINLNKKQNRHWNFLYFNNFNLSKNITYKLRCLNKGIYSAKFNIKNIYLTFKDLIFQVYNKYENTSNIYYNKKKIFSKQSMQIKADLKEIYVRLYKNFIINNKKKPISKISILRFKTRSIIIYYNLIAYNLLFYFQYVNNFTLIKKIVTYYIRYSLLCTLAQKHKCSIFNILKKFSKKIIIKNKKNKEISFINLIQVSNMKQQEI